MLSKIRIFGAIASVTYKEWAAYRSHMLVSLFVGPVSFIVQYFIWRSVFSDGGNIGGYTFEGIVKYYGVNILLNYFIMDFAGWNLQNHIVKGTFVTFMLYPVSHIYYALSQKAGHRFLGLMVEFIPVYLILWLISGVRLVPANYLYTAISMIFAFLISFYLNYSIGAAGFWLIKNHGIRSMFSLVKSIFAGVFIPLTFFPVLLQKVLFFLPFQYISFVPVSIFIGEYKMAGYNIPIPLILLCQGVMVLLTAGVSEIIVRKGIRKYVGVGV